MKTRYVFSNRDVAVSIIGAVLLFLMATGQDYLSNNGYECWMEYCYLPDVLLAIISGIFGIVPGVVAGISGRMLYGLFVLDHPEYVDIFSVALFAFFIGRNAYRFKVLKGGMDKNAAIDFNIIQLIVSFVTWIILALGKFLIFKEDLFEGINRCIHGYVGTALGIMFIATPVMYLVSRIFAKRVKIDG